MISNPCTWFIDGNTTKGFRYIEDPEAILFHWSPHDHGLERSMGCNVVFFARDVEQAKTILVDMFTMSIETHRAYDEHADPSRAHAERFISKNAVHFDAATRYRDAVLTGAADPVPAPRDQFFSVGWASNDTVLS